MKKENRKIQSHYLYLLFSLLFDIKIIAFIKETEVHYNTIGQIVQEEPQMLNV